MSGKRRLTAAWICTLAAFLVASAPTAKADNLPGATPSKIAHTSGEGNFTVTLVSGGFDRTYYLHLPAKYKPAMSKPLPLLIMLHGTGGSGVQAARQTGWDTAADHGQFIAVFPDALPEYPRMAPAQRGNPRVWNTVSGKGSAAHRAVDDLGFLSAVIDDVTHRYPVDPARIYLTGFASGASMTFYAVSSPLSLRIAAAAPVAGPYAGPTAAAPVRPTPVLLIIGDRDPINPLEDGTVKSDSGRNAVRPKVIETVNAWAKLIGGPTEPILISDKDGIKRFAYGPGKNGVEFLYWTVDGLGHHWPGSHTEQAAGNVSGPQSSKLDATDSIWKFLSRHTLALRAEAP